ncbi:MAG: class II aldolase/adducin family protein [Micromonosporaceae bacterium]
MTVPIGDPDPIGQLVELSRTLGRPERDLVVLAEGNTSVRTTGNRMLVKASGSVMAAAGPGDFVEVDTNPLLELVGSTATDDALVTTVMLEARRDSDGPRPSMEALVHAICLRQPGVEVVAHTHPVAVNAILCSDQAHALVDGALFPDQIVVLGRHAVLVPYADPGLSLARSVGAAIDAHVAEYDRPPKLVYLANHGIFVLAGSPREALAVTEMTVKTARVLSGVLAVGRPRYLSDAEADRIDTRPDEAHRRTRLAEATASEHRRPARAEERSERGADQIGTGGGGRADS